MMPFDLRRFTDAQERVYPQALRELRAGRKQTHWMWFVFPQLAGLGQSATSQHYAISGLDEARAYLAHPVLGARLRESAETLLRLPVAMSATDVFAWPDDMKLRSSMTLFELADEAGSAFSQVLDRYFDGQRDDWTLRLLARPGS